MGDNRRRHPLIDAGIKWRRRGRLEAQRGVRRHGVLAPDARIGGNRRFRAGNHGGGSRGGHRCGRRRRGARDWGGGAAEATWTGWRGDAAPATAGIGIGRQGRPGGRRRIGTWWARRRWLGRHPQSGAAPRRKAARWRPVAAGARHRRRPAQVPRLRCRRAGHRRCSGPGPHRRPGIGQSAAGRRQRWRWAPPECWQDRAWCRLRRRKRRRRVAGRKLAVRRGTAAVAEQARGIEIGYGLAGAGAQAPKRGPRKAAKRARLDHAILGHAVLFPVFCSRFAGRAHQHACANAPNPACSLYRDRAPVPSSPVP